MDDEAEAEAAAPGKTQLTNHSLSIIIKLEILPKYRFITHPMPLSTKRPPSFAEHLLYIAEHFNDIHYVTLQKFIIQAR